MAGDAGFGEIVPEPPRMRGDLVPEGQEDHADAVSSYKYLQRKVNGDMKLEKD